MSGMKTKPRLLPILFLLLALLLLWLGLNYRQIIAHGTIWNETTRLHAQALHFPTDFQNPAPEQDLFDGGLSSELWKFTTINGAGRVSNEPAWHAAAMTVENGLSLQHFPDPDFQNENTDMFQSPAADQYNNVTLVGGSGFRPTPTEDDRAGGFGGCRVSWASRVGTSAGGK
jgi:hypothetical protein